MAREWCIESTLFLCALLSIVTTLGIVYVLFVESIYDPFGRTPDPVVHTVDGRIDWSKRHHVGPFFQEISPVEFFTSTRWTPAPESSAASKPAKPASACNPNPSLSPCR